MSNMTFKIGETIGSVVDVDLGSFRLCFGRYLHVRVQVDVIMPSRRTATLVVK